MDQQDAQNRQINYEKNIELISEYHMGDIVWAKLVGCQFWPAMVTKDPLCSLFVKGNGRNRTYALHVRFCKFYGRRSWVTIVEKYCSEQDLVSKHPDYMYSSEKDFSEMVLWHEAVKVADHLSTLHPKDERMLHFFTIEDSPPTKERGIFGPALRDSEVRSSGVYCLDVNECFGPKVQKAIYSPVEELNDEHAIPQNAKKPKMEELKSDHLDLGLGNTQLTIAEIRKSVSALEKILKR